MINNYTVPLVSDSIAISLQKDLLEFYNETKFLLLFYDNPLTILSTHKFEVLNDETIYEIANNKLPKTIFGSDYDLINTNLVITDEWKELMSYCNVYTTGYEMIKPDISTNTLLSPGLQEHIQSHQLNPYETQLNDEDFTLADMFRDISNSLNKIKATTFEMQLWRLEYLLSECYKKKIPMVWSNDVDVAVCKYYLDYLLGQSNDLTFIKKPDSDARHLLGQGLLREILELEVVNVTMIPTDKIIEFKKSNKDLLNNFLSFYSSFLIELQLDPKGYKKIVSFYSNKLRNNLSEIQNELMTMKNMKKYSWLKSMSKGVFEALQSNLITGVWTLLSSSLTAAGKLLDVGKAISNSEIENSEKLNSLIINSSAGYLWKAKENFKKK